MGSLDVFFLFSKLNAQRIIESQNIPSWKVPIKVIESSSWFHTGPSKNQTIWLRALSKHFLNSSRLGLCPLPWAACSSAQQPFGEEPFPNTHLTLPCCCSMPFLRFLSLSPISLHFIWKTKQNKELPTSCKESVNPSRPNSQFCVMAVKEQRKEVKSEMNHSVCISSGCNSHPPWLGKRGPVLAMAAQCSFAPVSWGCKLLPDLLGDKTTPSQAGKCWGLDFRGSLVLVPKSVIKVLETFTSSPMGWILAAILGRRSTGCIPHSLPWGGNHKEHGARLLLPELSVSRATCICEGVKLLLKSPFQWAEEIHRGEGKMC